MNIRNIEPAFAVNNIPIVFSTDNNFVPYLGVAIKSLIEKSSTNNNYDIVILYSNVDKYNQLRLLSLAKDNVSIRFCDVTELMMCNKDNWHVKGQYSKSVYYRFFIPQIFNNYNKVLFLDADIIVNCDISELYNIELGDNLIGAVKDIPRLQKNDFYTQFIEGKLGIKPDMYFNAGILILNLQRFERNTFLNKCIEVLAILDKPLYQDQDVFNFLFKEKVLYIDNKYNVSWNCAHFWKDARENLPADIYKYYQECLNSPSIIHYAGVYKPWRHPWLVYSEYFWNIARQTIFYEEIIYKNTRTPSINREVVKNAVRRRRIYLQYVRCKVFSIFTFGNTKKHYKEKIQRLKNKINDYRKTLR